MKTTFSVLLFLSVMNVINVQADCHWTFKADSSIYSSPLVLDDVLFTGDLASNFYAINKFNGDVLWKRKLAGSVRSKPTHYQQLIIVNDGSGKVHALNRVTGKIVWQYAMAHEKQVDMWDYYLSSPLVDNAFVYVGGGDGHVYALNADTGLLKWKFETKGVVHASPVIKDERLLIGSFDGCFYAINKHTGEKLWQFKTVGDQYFPIGGIQKGACVGDGKVFFGSRDFNIYALDINTGRGCWNYKERGSWVIATPIVYNNQLLFGTSDTHRFLSMNASNGEINWTLPLNMRVYASAVVYENDVYFGCFNGKVYRANAHTGESELVFQTSASKQNYMNLFRSETEFVDGIELYGNNSKQIERRILDLGAILSTPVVEDRVMYFGDANGYLYALPLN
ncbi:PQQ-binding-like beta-propeller repeat protein [Carboxylicivirga sp. M1479]|uniref:outer membrane protein assembly factor BamB family protein n=1 Tax=Carboxylicivirga sp. M1479 TaxID=2594476 RepID=UPI001177C096|nr:PQQ-binding-like beta-propeller repeat protein [Carboxylicivirga sp. M1479]TRX66007.1 PQQ-binding-like beta-propeller repeat protein [Carboxylicivirga sp. M1479]